MDVIQREDEENRIAFLKTALFKYVELFSSQFPKITRAYKQLSQSFDTINPVIDSELFMTTLRTGESHPPDFQMSDVSMLESKKSFSLKSASKSKDVCTR